MEESINITQNQEDSLIRNLHFILFILHLTVVTVMIFLLAMGMVPRAVP